MAKTTPKLKYGDSGAWPRDLPVENKATPSLVSPLFFEPRHYCYQ